MASVDIIEAARRRPGMFIGGDDSQGLLHLAMEVIGNAFDQHLLGRCDRIEVEVASDGTVVVSDDGPGIAVEGDGERPPLAELLTIYRDLPTADGHRPHVHLTLVGVGLVTADGPITVDVALAWRDRHHRPSIASYVNYQRSREGTHVDGLLDGIRRVFGGKRAAHEAGLVAAVAVVLADVHWGNPTKDRLLTPSVRKPVADVTVAALQAWSAAHPDAAAALRARLSAR